MTDKAYIVVNEQQECEVLEKLEREGYLWRGTDMRPTEKHRLMDEPITIFARDDKRLSFDFRVNEAYLADYEIEIDFDGRKEEQMSDKYVVSQEFMNELVEWKEDNHLQPHVSFDGQYVSWQDLESIPMDIKKWWHEININDIEINNRLIAILRWVNGEDIFEVEKPKKWIVRSMATDNGGDYRYVSMFDSCFGITYADSGKDKLENATHFDTKEEAESWANAHQEVVEIESD